MRPLILILLFLSSPTMAEVYQWTDAEGNTHFGSQPPPGQRQQVEIRQSSPGDMGSGRQYQGSESDIIRQSRELDRRKREQRLEAAKSRYERRISEIGSDQEDRPGYVCTGAKNRLESARERWDAQKVQGYTLSEQTRHEQRIRDAQRHRDNICR